MAAKKPQTAKKTQVKKATKPKAARAATKTVAKKAPVRATTNIISDGLSQMQANLLIVLIIAMLAFAAGLIWKS